MTNWKLDAACNVTIHGDLWYAPVEETPAERKVRVRAANRICDGCPVARECAIASVNEHHGIWAGINVARPNAAPEKPTPARKPRKPRTHTAEARALIAEATRATATRKFNDFVERITTLHRSGLTYPELLTELAMSNAVVRQRLSRHDRLDLYSMLTGAAA